MNPIDFRSQHISCQQQHMPFCNHPQAGTRNTKDVNHVSTIGRRDHWYCMDIVCPNKYGEMNRNGANS